jgi:hypothetical protein
LAGLGKALQNGLTMGGKLVVGDHLSSMNHLCLRSQRLRFV